MSWKPNNINNTLIKYRAPCNLRKVGLRSRAKPHNDMFLPLLRAVAPKINVPPRFRDTAFFDKGENAVIKIPFIGNPRPRITWQREGETIESGGHYSVETQQRHAILTLRDVTNLDTGNYRLTAENELGSDSVIIKIQISGNS